MFITHYDSNSFFSSHQQTVLQSTFRPGCPTNFQVAGATWPKRRALQNWLLVWWEKGISIEYPARTDSDTNMIHLFIDRDVRLMVFSMFNSKKRNTRTHKSIIMAVSVSYRDHPRNSAQPERSFPKDIQQTTHWVGFCYCSLGFVENVQSLAWRFHILHETAVAKTYSVCGLLNAII